MGRRAELSVLASALQELEEGRGSLVLLVGEPGLGKTRLVQECGEQLLLASARGRTGGPPLWKVGGPLRLLRRDDSLQPLPAPP